MPDQNVYGACTVNESVVMDRIMLAATQAGTGLIMLETWSPDAASSVANSQETKDTIKSVVDFATNIPGASMHVIVGPAPGDSSTNDTVDRLTPTESTGQQLLALAELFGQPQYSTSVSLKLGGLPNNYDGSLSTEIVALYNSTLSQVRASSGYTGLISVTAPEQSGRARLDALNAGLHDPNWRAMVYPFYHGTTADEANTTDALDWVLPCIGGNMRCLIIDGILLDPTINVSNLAPQFDAVAKLSALTTSLCLLNSFLGQKFLSHQAILAI